MTLRGLCVALALFSVCSAEASIIFTPGNNPQPGEENILLTAGDTGTSIVGTTNQTTLDVTFTSTQTLVVTATGAITGDGTPLTNIQIALTEGGASNDYIINPLILTSCPSCGGTVTVSVDALLNGTPEGTFTQAFALGNGNNFVTVTTAGGESIGMISISAPQGFSSLNNLHISGPYTGVTGVPEPATLALVGIGLAGVGFARPRRLN